MRPPFSCKTHSRRRHHSLIPDACETFRHASLHIKSATYTTFAVVQSSSSRPHLLVFRCINAVDFIGRPFVKRFALCYQTVVYPVLSLTLAYCGQTAGWIKMALVMEVGLGPGHDVIDGDPAPLPKRRQSPQFSAHFYCGQTAGCIKMPIGTWYRVRPQPRRLCVRWRPSSPPKKGGQPLNFRPMSIVAKRLDASRCHLVRR